MKEGNTFGNNKFFNHDVETSKSSSASADVRLVKNYIEIRSLVINLVQYIFNNSDDEKCKTYIRDEFCLTFLFYFNEIDEVDKAKIISFLRDSNEAFEDVYAISANLDRSILERRYNRFRQIALATIKGIDNTSTLHNRIGPHTLPTIKDIDDTSTLQDLILTDEGEKFTMNQIALILFYGDASLPRENANKIVARYGYASGDALYNKFIKYSEKAFRRNGNVSIKMLRNKIKLIGSVVKYLPENKRSAAIDEIKHLQGFLVSLE